MEKKIVVPPGMLDAVSDEMCQRWRYRKEDWPSVKKTDAANLSFSLETALRWLAENPIVPTEKQFAKLYDDLSGVNDGKLTQRGVIEWQRRMFLAPEPSLVVLRVENTLTGCTLTRKEADELIAYINECTPPGR